MNFYVRDTVLDGWEKPYVLFTKAIYDVNGNVIDYKNETVTEFTLKPDSAGVACHAYRFAGVTSQEMGSVVTATLYASKNGHLYQGKTVEYSVLKYATNMFAKTNDDTFKTLLIDLLNYGAASQVYFDYNTANLVNAGLTAEQQAYATVDVPNVTSHTKLIKNDGATVSFKSVSLILQDKVTMNYYLNLSSYTGSVSDLELHVQYTDTYGKTRTEVIDNSEFEYKLYNGAYYYVANFSSLYAMQMREECTAEVFSKATGKRISNTVIYSIESYVASKSNAEDEKLVALVLSMMKYGDAAKAFFV